MRFLATSLSLQAMVRVEEQKETRLARSVQQHRSRIFFFSAPTNEMGLLGRRTGQRGGFPSCPILRPLANPIKPLIRRRPRHRGRLTIFLHFQTANVFKTSEFVALGDHLESPGLPGGGRQNNPFSGQTVSQTRFLSTLAPLRSPSSVSSFKL